MDTKERRLHIKEILMSTEIPVSATALAKRFNVSRQIIVGDIALLRASGINISATARGYLWQKETKKENDFGYVGIIACQHGDDLLLSELFCVVDYGGCLIDVMIEHPIYGQLSGRLDIQSRYDAEQFAAKVNAGEGAPLSVLTDGIHLHHIGCRDKDTFHRIEKALADKNILFQE